MSRKGNPQLVDLIMNNVISTSGYILLKYKEKIFSAKLDSNGDITRNIIIIIIVIINFSSILL